MPNMRKRGPGEDDLEIAVRVMDTVERQIGAYRISLEKVRMLRKEFALDPDLQKRALANGEAMSRLLIERGVPENFAYGMAAEDFQDEALAARAGIWTWDCCCTSCCLTSCECTLITSIGASPGQVKQG